MSTTHSMSPWEHRLQPGEVQCGLIMLILHQQPKVKQQTFIFIQMSDTASCLAAANHKQMIHTGRKECIGNFTTTSQPSSAPSETPTEDSSGTSSASISTYLGAKSHAKSMFKTLAAAVIGRLVAT